MKRREIAKLKKRCDAVRSGHEFAVRLMKKADDDTDSVGLRKDLAPVVAIFGLTLARVYAKDAVKELFDAAMPFVAAEAMLRMVPTLYQDVDRSRTSYVIDDACRVHDLLREAKRWHEDAP